MKRSARLSLKKETLAQLNGHDLRHVAGAADESAGTCYSCLDCVVDTIGIASQDLTNCCRGIPTFHRAGAAC